MKVACRVADLIDSIFGTNKRRGYPGHPEIELALIRLYEVTQEKRYLSLAGYFINERGVGENIFEQEREQEGHSYILPEMAHFKADYFQSHLPVREQQRVTGLAVRAMYLYSGMADFARLTNDHQLIEACERLYENTVSRQMYVTGGVGSACSGERFTIDFDLPSDSAYAESCASIGLMLFSSRISDPHLRKTSAALRETVRSAEQDLSPALRELKTTLAHVNKIGGDASAVAGTARRITDTVTEVERLIKVFSGRQGEELGDTARAHLSGLKAGLISAVEALQEQGP